MARSRNRNQKRNQRVSRTRVQTRRSNNRNSRRNQQSRSRSQSRNRNARRTRRVRRRSRGGADKKEKLVFGKDCDPEDHASDLMDDKGFVCISGKVKCFNGATVLGEDGGCPHIDEE